MFDPASRYATLAVKSLPAADGRTVSYVERRLLPPGASLPVLALAARQPGERSDLFAARTLGDPLLFWRIADANDAMDPDLPGEDGAAVTVPLPLPAG